jgi:hypothetical protein
MTGSREGPVKLTFWSFGEAALEAHPALAQTWARLLAYEDEVLSRRGDAS